MKIKKYILFPLVLAIPTTGQPLRMYLVVSKLAVSLFIFIDASEELMYFLNKKLVKAKPRYSRIERASLVFVHSARRLKPYF